MRKEWGNYVLHLANGASIEGHSEQVVVTPQGAKQVRDVKEGDFIRLHPNKVIHDFHGEVAANYVEVLVVRKKGVPHAATP